MNTKIPCVLTIAGSDSGAGAGIQADLKTFTRFHAYGTCAITAITAQNTVEVTDILPIPALFVTKQIDAVMEDIGANAWKTGMLVNKEIIEIVAQKAKQYSIKYLVVDPVIISSSGRRLLEEKAIELLINKLIPLSFVVTPNIDEAEVLVDIKIRTIDDMKIAAKKIFELGTKHVVIKGGHLPSNIAAIDILFNGRIFTEFSSPRIKTNNTHGTGCAFSSGLAAELAKGISLKEAVKHAKEYITSQMNTWKNQKIGKGNGPVSLF